MNESILRQFYTLQELADCANIPLVEVLKDDKTMKEAKKELETIILENHKHKIYYSESEKAWRTYLPDETKANNRKPLKRKSKQNLEKAIIEFYREKQQKESRDNLTLEEFYKEWLLYRRDDSGVKPKTVQENAVDWNKFFKDTELAKKPIKEINHLTLIEFFEKITKNRKYTRKRISNARSVINGIMKYGVKKKLIINNPISNVDFSEFSYKPTENQCNNVFSTKDVVTLLWHLKEIKEPDSYELAIQLFFYLFIRIGELKALKWEDVDFDEKNIYIRRQLTLERELKNDLTFSKRTDEPDAPKGHTSRGFRKQPLTDEAIAILKKVHSQNPNGEYIFEHNGNPLTTDTFNRRLRKYCQECGITYHSSHKIRFYNASVAYNGENLAIISKLMGHADLATTLRYLRDVYQNADDITAFQNLGLAQSTN